MLMTNTRGSLGPPERYFFGLSCCSSLKMVSSSPTPRLLTVRCLWFCFLVFWLWFLIWISDAPMIFIRGPAWIDFPPFLFYNTTRGPLQPQFEFAPANLFCTRNFLSAVLSKKDKRLREGVSRAQILLQGGSLIITRTVHHSTIKWSVIEVENIPSLKGTENQN